MRVVIQSDSRILGGNEKWLLLVAQGLAGRGHDVLVSCKPGRPVDERARTAGLRVTHRRPGGDADLIRATGFAMMLSRERPDAVLLTALKRVFWGGWAARRAGVRRVVQRLGIEHDLPPRWKYRHAFRHYVDAMIVNSGTIRARWLRSAPRFPAGAVHVVHNGVRPPERTGSTLRGELGLPEGTPIVGGAGRLEHRKGFDVLLAAVAESGTGAHLVVAGAGGAEPELRSRAAELGLAERVHWLGYRSDLDNVLLGVDVFVVPSRREGMANVMLEAMAAGCLVVATDISGVREALGERDDRGAAGWIVPPEDPAAMGAAVRQALEVAGKPDEGEAMRTELGHRVRHWFSVDRMITEVEAVLWARTPG